MRSTRRAWICGSTAALFAACRGPRCSGAPALDAGSAELALSELSFDEHEGGPQLAVVLSPRWVGASERVPVLIALHGRGESNRGLAAGAWGWVREYGLDKAMLRLRHPPLHRSDLQGIGSDQYLDRLNRALEQRPFRGLVVVCPYTPDILATTRLDAAAPFAAFAVDHLLPRVRGAFAADPSPAATGIDGVSLGGRMSLLAATHRPDAFGAVGSLQAAMGAHEAPAVAAAMADAFGSRPHAPAIRLLTSDEDPFRPALVELSAHLQARRMQVELSVVPGPHDYDFNRGPGAYEMLLWHDRVLRGEPGI